MVFEGLCVKISNFLQTETTDRQTRLLNPASRMHVRGNDVIHGILGQGLQPYEILPRTQSTTHQGPQKRHNYWLICHTYSFKYNYGKRDKVHTPVQNPISQPTQAWSKKTWPQIGWHMCMYVAGLVMYVVMWSLYLGLNMLSGSRFTTLLSHPLKRADYTELVILQLCWLATLCKWLHFFTGCILVTDVGGKFLPK